MTSRASRTGTGTRTEEMTMAKVNQTYYVPDQSRWPIIGAIALFFLALGRDIWSMKWRVGRPVSAGI